MFHNKLINLSISGYPCKGSLQYRGATETNRGFPIDGLFHDIYVKVIFFIAPYSGIEVWEGIWNQTRLESNPFSGIGFLSREITPRYHILR